MDVAARYGYSPGYCAVSGEVYFAGIGSAARALPKLPPYAVFFRAALERIEHLRPRNGASVHKGDGCSAMHSRHMLMTLDLRHIVRRRSLEYERNVRLYVVRRSARPAKPQLLLHSKHSVKITIIIVFEKLCHYRAAHSVVQRLAAYHTVAKLLKLCRKGNVVADADIFLRIRLIRSPYVYIQTVMIIRLVKLFLALEMYRL